jgi:glycosyltransferase involved in cell wall biosynthesis
MADNTVQNKKIVFVANTGWSMMRFRSNLIDHLVNEGYDVYIVAPSDNYLQQLSKRPGVTTIELKYLQGKKISVVADFLLYQELKKIYRSVRPLLIFHYTIKPNIYGSLSAGAVGIPSVSVITGLGYTFMTNKLIRKLVVQLYKKALLKANAVWFLNEDDRDTFLEQRILSAYKAFTLPGEGVDTEKFYNTYSATSSYTTKTVFLLFCRITRHKGIAEYIRAAALLKQQGIQVECQLLGFFEADNPTVVPREEIQSAERVGYIRYLGDTENVIPFIEKCDCVVLPSYGEGLPFSLLEAASLCKPIIASNSNGCRDLVVDGVTGYLCAPRNSEDLALKMLSFISLSHHERKLMGQKGRTFIEEKYSVKKVIAIYMEKIQSIEKTAY